jgi:hypothetical protein
MIIFLKINEILKIPVARFILLVVFFCCRIASKHPERQTIFVFQCNARIGNF